MGYRRATGGLQAGYSRATGGLQQATADHQRVTENRDPAPDEMAAAHGSGGITTSRFKRPQHGKDPQKHIDSRGTQTSWRARPLSARSLQCFTELYEDKTAPHSTVHTEWKDGRRWRPRDGLSCRAAAGNPTLATTDVCERRTTHTTRTGTGWDGGADGPQFGSNVLQTCLNPSAASRGPQTGSGGRRLCGGRRFQIDYRIVK